MTTLRESWREVNRPHPLVAAPMAGLIAVALVTLVVPGGLERTHAWLLFVAVGAGAGLGRFIDARYREYSEGSRR